MTRQADKESIFTAALELDASAQAAFLDAACGDDAELRALIGSLLKHDAEAGSFIDRPAVARLSTIPLDADGESLATVIGPYKLLQQIGEGGMGVVYMAEQTEPVRRRVALKIIKPGMDTRQVITRFEAERQALSLMDHPNIARVLDAGMTLAGRPYFVMELVKGQPINEYCDAKHLNPRQRLELLLPVCHAIQHAHQKGIIHRDIKPTNILVAEYDERAVPKVIDFGVAKATSQALTERTMFTCLGQIVGTLEYMSPEQAKLNQLDIDTRSDVYSLGVLLYELLTGSTPFDKDRLRGAGWDEMLRIIREEEPPPPSTRLSDVSRMRPTRPNADSPTLAPGASKAPDGLTSIAALRRTEPAKLTRLVRGELDWIVMKCLEKCRDRRYQTANALARDIERYLKDESVEASPPGRGYRLQRFAKRNKGRLAAAGMVLAALLAGIVGTTWGMIRAEQAWRASEKSRIAEATRATAERQAKQEAQKRLAQLERGTEILASVLQDLDPIAAEKAGVSSIDLLCRRLVEASQELEGEAVGDPLVVARLQHLVGVSLRELRHPNEAEPVLRKACQTRQRLLGADHLDTVATKHHLAILYRDKRELNVAEALFDEVLAVRTARLGADDLDTLTTKHHVVALYRYQGKLHQAEALAKQVVAIRTAKLGPDDLDTVATKHHLALACRDRGKYDQAEALFQDVVAVRAAKLGEYHQDTIHAKTHFAILYRIQQKYEQAEAMLTAVVTGSTALLGADHEATCLGKLQLAHVYYEQQKFAEAEELYRYLVSVHTAKYGADHAHTLNLQCDLATVSRELLDLDKAILLLEDTFRRCKATSHPATPSVQVELGAAYREAGRLTDATALLEDLEDTYRSCKDSERGPVGNALLLAYLAAGKKPEAANLATELIRTARDQFAADSLELAAALEPPAQGLLKVDAFAEAEPLYQEILAIRIARLGADHPETTFPRDCLAGIYRSMQRPKLSIPLLEKSLQLTRSRLDAEHPEIQGRLATLGAVYCDAGRFEEGLPLIEEVRKRRPSAPHPAWVRSVLLTAYVQAGKTAEATLLVQERLQEVRSRYSAPCPSLAAELADNGKVLLDAKAYAEAEPLLLEAHQILHQDASESGRLPDVITYLVELYDASGRPEEAAKWRKEMK